MDKDFINIKNVDILDICDVLTKIEKSFNIKLDNESLKKANTLKSLSDLVVSKIDSEHEESCTTQHAFYMLRNVISTVTGINKCDITTHTRFCKLLPKEDRLETIAKIDDELGFKTNLLKPKQWIVNIFALILIVSGIFCFYNLFVGMAGLLMSVVSLKLAGKFGKEMHLKTVGDLACKISRESYTKLRRSNTINKNEVEQKVKELFINELNLEPIVLTRKSRF
ncbi:MAG TPA: hypothetical protein VGM63_15380 [Mucilaginibacter sp.]|jgi:acyl carrier protein